MLEIQRFDPAKCQFPRPSAELLPTLNWSQLTLGGAAMLPQALIDGPGVWHFSRGRYALEAAYRSAGVGPAGALLAPAYHCRTMLDPALALGGAVRFYAVGSDLTADIESIETALAMSQPSVRALVVPHYFGFEQPAAIMRELAELCIRHGVMLIEDCSHAWQIAIQRAPACQAAAGHVIVASPYKFFACPDGGMLWGNPGRLAVARQSAQGIVGEAKAIKATFGHTMQRTAMPDATAAVSARWAGERGEDRTELSDQPSAMYCRDFEGKRSLAMSRWIMRRTKMSPAIQQRRQHYREWVEAISRLRGGRALFPELSADCAPYMFPLLISAPNPQFFQLKQAGVPIWRWDEMAVSNCPVASNYRLHLLHLPCHQSLTAAQMRWMTTTVARVLA